METKGNRDLRCVHRKTSFEEDTLGFILRLSYYENFELKAIYTDLQYVSQTAFNQDSNQKREFLPLIINDEHSKKAFPILDQLFTKLGNWKEFHQHMVLIYVPKLLNSTVISFVTQGIKESADINQQTEQTLLKYAHFHHMLLAYAHRFPDLTARANRKLKEFKESADKRTKQIVPDLGEFLTYLALSDYHWRDFAISFLKEFFDRNTLSIVRKFPELSNLTNKNDTCFRLTQSLDVTSTARRILMFQLLFIHLIDTPTSLKGQDRIKELLDAYNARQGAPAPGVLEKVIKNVQKISQENDSWNSFFDNVRVNHLSPENLSALLKESVLNSSKKKYHGKPLRSESQREIPVCLCNNPNGCFYKVKSSSSQSSPAVGQQKSKSLPTPSSSQPTKPVGNAWKTPLTIKPVPPTPTPAPATVSHPTTSVSSANSPGQNKNNNLWRPKGGKDQKHSPQPTTAPLQTNSTFPSVTLGHTIGHTIIDPNAHHLSEAVSIDHRLYGQHLEINEALIGDHHVDLSSLAADIAASHDLSPPINDLEHHNSASHQQPIKREKKLSKSQSQSQRERDSVLSPFAKPFTPGILWLTSDQQQQQPVYRATHTRSRPNKSRLPNAETDPSLIHESLNDNYLYQPLSAPSAAESTILSLLSPSLTDPSWSSSSALSVPVILTPPTSGKSFSDHHQQQQQYEQQLYHPDPANSFAVHVSDEERVETQVSRGQQQQQQQQQSQQPQQQQQQQQQQQAQREKRERQDSQKGRQTEKSDRERHPSEKQEKERERQDRQKKETYRSRENSRKEENNKTRSRSINEERKSKEETKAKDKSEHDQKAAKPSRRPLTRLTPNPQAAAAAARHRNKSENNEKSALHEITQQLATTHAQTQGAKRARDPQNPWGKRPVTAASAAAGPPTTSQNENKTVSTDKKRVSRERSESGANNEEKQESKRKVSGRKPSESESQQPTKRETEQPRRNPVVASSQTPSVTSRPKNNPWGNIAVAKTSIASTFTEAQNEDSKNRGKPANVYANVSKTEATTLAKRTLPVRPSGQGRPASGRDDNNRGRRDNNNRGRRDENNRDFPKRRDNRDFPKKRDDSRDFPKKRDQSQNRDFPQKRNYPRRDGGRFERERNEDDSRRRNNRDDDQESGNREGGNRGRSYNSGYQRRRDGSEDDGERRGRGRYRRGSEDEDGFRRGGGRDRNYGYDRRQGVSERSDWRRRGEGGDAEEDSHNVRREEEEERGGRRETRRERTDSEPRGPHKEEPAPVFNPYASLLRKTKTSNEGSEEEEEETGQERRQKKSEPKKRGSESKPQTNGVDEEDDEEKQKKERRFALPQRAVKELRPVTDAKAVESNDVTDVRKQLSAWEQKQLKETAIQQRRVEQQQRFSERRGGGGRQWGDIMERGPRRGGRTGQDDRRDDRREGRDQDRESSRPVKNNIDDIEIPESELESASNRKPSVGSDRDDDHSFDDEPKKTES